MDDGYISYCISLSLAHCKMTSSYCTRINTTVCCSLSLKPSSSVFCTSVTRKKHGKSCRWSLTTCEQCFPHWECTMCCIIQKRVICWSCNFNIQYFSLSDLNLRWRKEDGVHSHLLALDRSSFRWVRVMKQLWSPAAKSWMSVLDPVCLKTQVSLCWNVVF